MRIGEVIGTVTLSTCHPSLTGGRYRLIVPYNLDELTKFAAGGQVATQTEELVVYDDLGAGLGSIVAFSEGVEAAQPFAPNYKPLDAYNAAILDRIEIKQ
jgi:ethanolamine utilization protein EutN